MSKGCLRNPSVVSRSLTLERDALQRMHNPCFPFDVPQFMSRQAIKLESARLLLYRAAANADRGFPSTYDTAVAKAACNLAGLEVAHESVQIMGALGYSRDTLVDYCMRRTRGWMIAGGPVEILKNRIAEHVFDRRFDQRPRHADAAE